MMRFFMNTASGNREHKQCSQATVMVAFLVVLIFLHYPFYSQETDPVRDDTALQTLITSSFAGTFKTQIAKEGSDLQYIAKTFYGAQLGWPLVWYFNVESIPDPERIKAGTEIKIPRLKNGLDEKTAFQVLEGAYILAYKRYLSLVNRSDGQRRWVLLQATESGCDLAGDIWEGVLSESDLAWSEDRGIKVVAKKTVPLVVAAEPILLADLVSAAAKSDETAMGQLAVKFEKAGKIDDVIADLETKATAADAPPEVFLALSILYGRKGLRTKEYAALAAAETAAARPGVTFNVAVVYGRKQFLAGAPDADSFMVGSLDLVSTPAGAIVFVDGMRIGVTPLIVDKVKAGVRRIRLEADGYQSAEAELAVDVGASVPARYTLKGKPGSVLVTTNPPGAVVWLDKFTENGQSGVSPFIFEKIDVGKHTLSVEDYFRNDKDLYFGQDPVSLIIDPGKQSAIRADLVRGKGFLHLAGFPEGSAATVDGKAVDSRAVFGDGLEIDSGRYLIEVTAPTSQKWKCEVVVREENTIRITSDILVHSLARRTVKIDGKVDDWQGLLPVRHPATIMDNMSKQTGTAISDIYMCRDDKYLYWKIDFSDGTPTAKLSADVFQSLYYNIQVFRPTGDRITMYIAFEKDKSPRTWANLYNPATDKSTSTWENCISYKTGEGFLEARISLGLLGAKLPKGPLVTKFSVVNADQNGEWRSTSLREECKIDYYE